MATRKSTRKDNTTSRTIGAGAGVVGGAATGAALGSIAGPVGTAIGAVAGGVAGGFAGHEIAEAIDPAQEEKYWKGEYQQRPYYVEGTRYEEYRPAYRFGVEACNRYPGQTFEDVEARLRRKWPQSRGDSSLTWGKARGAVQDAYDRTLRLHEERLRIDKDEVQSGEVTVSKEVKTERQRIDVPVEREEVVIHRRPARGKAQGGSVSDGEEIRIPVKEERVHVSKETVPVEEVSVGRRKVRNVRHIDESVRKEQVKVHEKGRVKVTGNGSSATRR